MQWKEALKPTQLLAIAGLIIGVPSAMTASAAVQDAQDTAPLPTSPAEWSEAAQRDVEAAYVSLRDNHPGIVDPDNPDFARQLASARDLGLQFARRVTTPMGYDAAIAVFGNALQDGHAGAFATLPLDVKPARQWPGFVPAWRGNQMLVHFSSETNAPRGAEILSCDGTAIRALALRNVFRFGGRASEAGSWWTQARNVLVDTGNPFVTRPSSCRLRQDGRSWTIRLNWRAEEGPQLGDWRRTSYNGVTLPIGITRPANGITWIAMPNFNPDAAGVVAYQLLNTQLENERSTVMEGRAIVLDLRNNQGGSSEWSRAIANRLWGNDVVNGQMGRYFATTSVEWRASAANEAHVRATSPQIREEGYADTADQWLRIADLMAAARAQGRALIEAPRDAANMALPPLVASDLTLPVYVIVPGQCASACLDALDVFTRFPNTHLIGAPSSGDSKYMEVRSQALPSGLASVVIPNKMWINRPRGHGVGYHPEIQVTALDWSTEDFLRVIENDLAHRRGN